MDCRVAAISGLVGSISSTSTAAYCGQYVKVMTIFKLKPYRLMVEGTDQCVAVAIFSCCNRSLGFDNRVDTTDCVAPQVSMRRLARLKDFAVAND